MNDRLEHYDVPALCAEALLMPDVCPTTKCVAPTVHLLATLLQEAEAALARAEQERNVCKEQLAAVIGERKGAERLCGTYRQALEQADQLVSRFHEIFYKPDRITPKRADHESANGLIWQIHKSVREALAAGPEFPSTITTAGRVNEAFALVLSGRYGFVGHVDACRVQVGEDCTCGFSALGALGGGGGMTMGTRQAAPITAG